jgi:hypothetical protein
MDTRIFKNLLLKRYYLITIISVILIYSFISFIYFNNNNNNKNYDGNVNHDFVSILCNNRPFFKKEKKIFGKIFFCKGPPLRFIFKNFSKKILVKF